MVSLIGDAEMDEGNIYEALIEVGTTMCGIAGGSWTQPLVTRRRDPRSLWQRFEQIFKNFGWNVLILGHGSLQQAA
jgi:pyruvate dehydrogenase E1 component